MRGGPFAENAATLREPGPKGSASGLGWGEGDIGNLERYYIFFSWQIYFKNMVLKSGIF